MGVGVVGDLARVATYSVALARLRGALAGGGIVKLCLGPGLFLCQAVTPVGVPSLGSAA